MMFKIQFNDLQGLLPWNLVESSITCKHFLLFTDQDLLEEMLLDSKVYPCYSIVSEHFYFLC